MRRIAAILLTLELTLSSGCATLTEFFTNVFTDSIASKYYVDGTSAEERRQRFRNDQEQAKKLAEQYPDQFPQQQTKPEVQFDPKRQYDWERADAASR